MASVSAVPAEVSFPVVGVPKINCRPLLSAIVFFACDMVSLVLAVALVSSSESLLGQSLALRNYLALWPGLGVFIAIFFATHLYPGVIYNAVTELRRLGLALSLSFLIIAVLLTVARSTACSSWVLIFSWIVAITVTPMLRALVRNLVCRTRWWGVPVAIFHTGDESCDILRELQANPQIGLKPVVVLSHVHEGGPHLSLPVLDLHMAAAVRAVGVECAMIALPSSGSARLLEDLERFESVFPRLMIVHNSVASCSISVDARELAGCLAVDLRRDLLLPLPRLMKRVMDLLVIFLALPAISLAILALAALVKLESPGPAFYGHRRIGLGHSKFRIWKLRTMQVNGDELLQRALASDEKVREEWRQHRKLRRDPRVTRIGRFLRKTSLDELPQVWNVLRGEMSLVGPRPIVDEEIANYGRNFALYCRVSPGLTGLWQISGRNDVTCRDRVRLDSYYVRNWSPWLDLYILARTAKVVLTGAGAY
jgi:Undecaprenyl-phosphate galactose phosphotransferase WbaP